MAIAIFGQYQLAPLSFYFQLSAAESLGWQLNGARDVSWVAKRPSAASVLATLEPCAGSCLVNDQLPAHTVCPSLNTDIYLYANSELVLFICKLMLILKKFVVAIAIDFKSSSSKHMPILLPKWHKDYRN